MVQHPQLKTKKVSEIEYTPTKEDFNKTLSLVVYEKGAAGVTVFSQTISGDTVKQKIFQMIVTLHQILQVWIQLIQEKNLS